MALSIINMSGIDAAISIISLLGVLLELIDKMILKLSGALVSDVLLSTAKATHCLPNVNTSMIFRPQGIAPIQAADSKIRSPESSSSAMDANLFFDIKVKPNTPEVTTDTSISPTIIAEADSVKSRAVSCDTEPGDQHDDTWEMQSRITFPGSGGSGYTSASTPDLGHVDVMSNHAQTSKDGDTHMNSCEGSNQAKTPASSIEYRDIVSPNSTGPCGSDDSVEAVTGEPDQGSGKSLFSAPPSPQLSDRHISFNTRFDDVCTPDKVTEASSSVRVITPPQDSQSSVQGDQNTDAMSELDTSEFDIRRASESDFSPKSSASSTASSVVSASSMSVPHEQSYGTSEMGSFAPSQPHTSADEVASAKVDFRSVNCSIRPQYRVEYPHSTQITCSNMGMNEWYTHRPRTGTDSAECASQPWSTDNILDFDQTKSSYSNIEKARPDCSTECDEDLEKLQERANFNALGSGDPQQDVHDVAHHKIPKSLARRPLIADTSLAPATTGNRVSAASPPPGLFCMTISMDNNEPSDAGQAVFISHQYGAGQALNGNTDPRVNSQDKQDCRVHTYRHNFPAIAALVVEERNVTRSEENQPFSDSKVPSELPTDSEPDLIDISFIPQAVRQHAESQKKSRQATNQGSSQRGKKSKNSKKKTGRLNKERACIEKVLQPANEEAIDEPTTSENPTEKVTDARLPKDGYEQDLASKIAAKKKQKRRIRRQQMSPKPRSEFAPQTQDAQIEQPVVSTCTSIDEQTGTSEGANSDETIGVLRTATERSSGSETPSDYCTEAKPKIKSLEDDGMMDTAVTTSQLARHDSTNVANPADDHDENAVQNTDNGGITTQQTYSTVYSAVEAAQDGINADAIEPSPVQTEQYETMATKSEPATTVHGTTSDGDTIDLDCHIVAAHEVLGRPSPLRNRNLTPIPEEVEPETDSPINDVGDDSSHMVTRLAATEPTAPAFTGDTAEPHAHMQLTRFVQQEPPQEGLIEYCTDSTAYHEYPHQLQAYNEGTWPNYGPAPLTNYRYYHMEPDVSYQSLFSNQLPEYYPPYFDHEPYVSTEQPQYFEPFYAQYYEFCDQVPLSRYEPFGYATPRRLQISWQEWQPYAERYPGQPFGIRTHRKEPKDKPWHLQTLGYEEELEEEFQSEELTQRERTRRSCRKYGL